MKFILSGPPYRKKADILVRVYEAQRETDEKSQCVGEIRFRPRLKREPVQFTAWLPRGLVAALKKEFAEIKGNYTVQISNELPGEIGVLTSCGRDFDWSLRNEFLPMFKVAK